MAATRTPSRPLGGGCLCGKVRFQVRPPTLWCAHCHCTMCRRAHGAGFVTWLGVAEDRFRLLGDEAAVAWYASSPDARRGFCRHCGTTLLFQSRRWPGEMHVALATLDGEADRPPAGHVYFDTHVPWLNFGDGLPRRPDPAGGAPP